MRRLPGISIVDVPPPLADGLPVMDVPVFVGFAERGPLDRPVAVEDPAQYATVFGGGVALVPEAASSGLAGGEMLRAHLPAAVASFFAGGGRRCYVVRVAGGDADTARFAVPGLRLAVRERVAVGAADGDAAGGGAGAAGTTLAGPWTLADADFTLRAASPGAWADWLELATRLSGVPLHAGDRLRAGDVLRARSPAPANVAMPTGWLRADRDATIGALLANARAADWLWTDADGRQLVPAGAPRPDLDGWLLDRITIDLALRRPDAATLRRDGCALAAGGSGDQPWTEADALARFDAGDDLTTVDWPLAGPDGADLAALVPATDAGLDLARGGLAAGATAADWMLVPAAVGIDFGPWSPARVAPADALARNGLADCAASLFIDPAFADPELRGAELRALADDLRFLGPAPRRLRGLHAALGRDDAVARDATWIAVPDAVHPGWTVTKPPVARDGLLRLVPDPACTCEDLPAFSACVQPPKRPQPPVLDVTGEQPADVEWLIDAPALDTSAPTDDAASPPADASPPDASPPPAPVSIEAQLARLPDFADARPLTALTGAPDTSVVLDARGRPLAFAAGARVFAPARYSLRLVAGLVFLRARVWRDGLASDWSATVEVHAVAAGRVARATPADGADLLLPVHLALMNLCAATREHFALLAAPRDWSAAQIAAHVATLRAEAAREVETSQAPSFVALHHPWLLQRDGAALVAHPPEGALLGQYARRTRDKGAWSAAGLDPLPDAAAPASAVDAEAIEAAGANAIEARPRGLAATRAYTLSLDADWQAIGVRRLFILLRRLARREGERYAFEPNDLTLRRSLERSFDTLLGALMQRGAFRGSRAPDCYLLRTASGEPAAREIERGECSLEIRVAPSRPLRFLTLRVVRAGEQLTIED
ncbi:hypothetical protein [Derxia gummosa]|uniref:Tail sheath protein C-terminal domain-containing protein n=1 Tax=Derxia gummosa DSM 723 TaxID=1121388 RepID=A0A8B6X1G4_9BURK|nr:hypothetical protein [Derxia gummosa]